MLGRFTTLCLALITALAMPRGAMCQEMETVQEVDTVAGQLTLDKFDLWGFLHLQGQTIAQDFVNHMHIVSQLPKTGKAEFVFYYIWNGGNCCEPDQFLLDAGAKPPKVLSIRRIDESQIKTLQHKPGIIRLQAPSDETTRFGDTIIDVLEYHRGDGNLAIVRHSAVETYGEYDGQVVSAFLADPVARFAVVELIGLDDFAYYRKVTEEHGDPMKLVGGRYLVGTGAGHGYIESWIFTILVVDTFFDRAWAIQYDLDKTYKDEGKTWGELSEDEMAVRALLDDWLRQFGKETAWKTGPIQIVDSALVPAPPPPTWHPRLPDTMQPY